MFLIVITNLLLLIGAGLFSKAVGSFQDHAFQVLSALSPSPLSYSPTYLRLLVVRIGFDADDTGDGPGTFDVRGNVWHLDCCNPENNLDGNGWGIFGAIFGWTNNGTRESPVSSVVEFLLNMD